ncbi:MAG: glycosyltransferase family 1 protein [Bacteroidetes bacterium HGW-Bacteroidetes-7]|jgi:glycosyltransferase involved in cell wall biosynthesis|nr:MAG: glycosyltransferase family 1 protein [Bacteroidetes bacterium HGW-Bacteroidetes-7]
MYRIGFDARRAFKNFGGLGNYSRSAITSLSQFFNYNEYFLYTPPYKDHPLFAFKNTSNITIRTPKGISAITTAYWREYSINKAIEKDQLDLYHGLTGELPLSRIDVPKIITIHDLDCHRYPMYYRRLDRWLFSARVSRSVKSANRIIAISKQTADDIVEFFGTDRSKIDIVHPSCDPQFYTPATEEKIQMVKQMYNLPKRFIVAMGAIEERKNVVSIVKALPRLPKDIKLYCFGRWTPYTLSIMATAEALGVRDRVTLIHDADFSLMPAIYSLAEALLYVSHTEGFGIPVLEGITYGVPVITSGGSSMVEAGGVAAMYVNPLSPSDIGDKIEMVLSSPTLKRSMIESGFDHAKQFRNDKAAEKLFEVYTKTINEYKR